MQRRQPEQRILYHLYGVVVHHGHVLHGGHYVAYIRSRRADIDSCRAFTQTQYFDSERLANKQSFVKMLHEIHEPMNTSCRQLPPSPSDIWYEISDSTVKQTTQADVLSKNVYMLFYERVR